MEQEQLDAPWNAKYRQVQEDRKAALAKCRETLAHTQERQETSGDVHRRAS